jgi:hypothetical protein
MEEWDEKLIVDEFHGSKQSILDQYEEDATF